MERKKVGLVLASIILLLVFSCESQPDVSMVIAEVVPTTTTTVRPPVMIVSQTTTTTLAQAPKPNLPSISEPELRNLFAPVNNAFNDIVEYGLEALLPEQTLTATSQFNDLKTQYETQMRRYPYDGTIAYPLANELRNLGKSLDSLLAKGIPLRSDVERTKALTAADHVRTEATDFKSSDRFKDATLELENGIAFHVGAQYRSSIASFRRANLLFESTLAQAEMERIRKKVNEAGYRKYSPYHASEADRLISEEAALYALSDLTSLTRSVTLMQKVTQIYRYLYAWGMECRASEAGNKALSAKQAAEKFAAQINAPNEFTQASALMEKGIGDTTGGEFDSATRSFEKAADTFMEAQSVALNSYLRAAASLAFAQGLYDLQKEKIDARNLGETPNYLEAKRRLMLASENMSTLAFESSLDNSKEALNQLRISEAEIEARLAEKFDAEIAKLKQDATILAKELADSKRMATDVQKLTSAELKAKQAEIESLNAEKIALELRLAEAELQNQTIRIKASEELAAAMQLATIEPEQKPEPEKIFVTIPPSEAELLERQIERDRLLAANAELERIRAENARLELLLSESLRNAQSQAEKDRLALAKAAQDLEYAARAAAEQKAAEVISVPESPIEPVNATRLVTPAATPEISLDEFAELPAKYIIDMIPERKDIDSLWNIAACTFIYNDPLKWPILYEANKATFVDPNNPDLLISGQVIEIPSIQGEVRSGIWDPQKIYPRFGDDRSSITRISQEEARRSAQIQLDSAQKAYDQALSWNAKNNYPELFNDGAGKLAKAKTAQFTGNYESAIEMANSALSILSGIEKFARLPARYKVRNLSNGSDSLWRIAGYSFAYGDSFKWQKLFEANRGLSGISSNPDLIRPGDIIIIPSLAGEPREGIWDPKKSYPPLNK